MSLEKSLELLNCNSILPEVKMFSTNCNNSDKLVKRLVKIVFVCRSFLAEFLLNIL